jgi:uncharacterized protein (TIGR03382 family)
VGSCQAVPDGQDPRQSCQASSGGNPACAGTCHSGQCAYPAVGTSCGLCAGCDGTGRCTATPRDDATCGTIVCHGLDTQCRTYTDLTTERCATLGACKVPNDPAACTSYTDLPCSDGGAPPDAASPPPGQDAGGPPTDAPAARTASGGCGAAPRASATGLLGGVLLGLALVGRRRRRR